MLSETKNTNSWRKKQLGSFYRARENAEFEDRAYKRHTSKLLRSIEKKVKEASDRSVSVLNRKVQLSQDHIRMVEEKKRQHEQEVYEQKLRNFERLAEKQNKIREYNEYKDQSTQQLINLKKVKLNEKLETQKNNMNDIEKLQKKKKLEILRKHGKQRTQMYKKSPFNSEERLSRFLNREREVEQKNREFQMKIIKKHMNIKDRVNKINSKK